jgi:hypothetical protein
VTGAFSQQAVTEPKRRSREQVTEADDFIIKGFTVDLVKLRTFAPRRAGYPVEIEFTFAHAENAHLRRITLRT